MLLSLFLPLNLVSKNSSQGKKAEDPEWVFCFFVCANRELKRSVKDNPSRRRIGQRRRPEAEVLRSGRQLPAPPNTESPALSWVFLCLHVPPGELKRSVKQKLSWRKVLQRRRPGVELPGGVGQLPAPPYLIALFDTMSNEAFYCHVWVVLTIVSSY